MSLATKIIVDKSAAAIAADTQGAAWLAEEYRELQLQVDVTAVSGTTPTLDITLQCSDDATTWFDFPSTGQHGATLAQITDATGPNGDGTGGYMQCYSNIGKYVRIDYDVEGTNPSFTLTAKLILKT